MRQFAVSLLLSAALTLFISSICSQTHAADQCPLPSESETKEEAAVLQLLCAQNVDGAVSLPPVTATNTPITAKFLSDLILDPKYAPVTASHGLNLSRVVVSGELNLTGARITRNIAITDSNF
jgi:hypothetical protein